METLFLALSLRVTHSSMDHLNAQTYQPDFQAGGTDLSAIRAQAFSPRITVITEDLTRQAVALKGSLQRVFDHRFGLCLTSL